MKYVLFVVLTIFAAACSKCPETTLTTNNVSVESMSQGQKVVCNEFGVAYYEFKTTHNHFVYSPVYIHYSSGGVNAISCEDYSNYIEMKEKKYGKLPR